MAHFDVLIAGAGPGGSATAISLAAFAPHLKVCVVDSPRAHGPPNGEVLSPLITPLLDHIGLRESFLAQDHSPSCYTASAWGAPRLLSNEFILGTKGLGWRIDRARFVRWLLGEAGRRSALLLSAKVIGLRWDHEWIVDCAAAGQHTARLVVDATGRSAALTRSQELVHEVRDRLTAYFTYMVGGSSELKDLLIESVPEGWWYTAVVPDGRRIVVCMTDSDIAHELGLRSLDRWMAALAGTLFIAKAAEGSKPITVPQLWPAGTRHLETPSNPQLLCVGDSAACFDPIFGHGIIKAMRSGIFASYAIADQLNRADDSGMRRFHAFNVREYESYRRTRVEYYRHEQRWPNHKFWRRRQLRFG